MEALKDEWLNPLNETALEMTGLSSSHQTSLSPISLEQEIKLDEPYNDRVLPHSKYKEMALTGCSFISLWQRSGPTEQAGDKSREEVFSHKKATENAEWLD